MFESTDIDNHSKYNNFMQHIIVNWWRPFSECKTAVYFG